MLAPKIRKAPPKPAESLIGDNWLALKRSIPVAQHLGNARLERYPGISTQPEPSRVPDPRGLRWDFGQVSVVAPERKGVSQTPPSLQPKLLVAQATDPFEHEASRFADQVMRTPNVNLSFRSDTPVLDNRAKYDAEGPALQTKSVAVSNGVGREAPGVVQDVLRSPGHPLDAQARSFMEDRFGHDFRHVRVHSDARAAESAAAVHALAYTVGSDIVFAAGQYSPHSARGRYLLAHEMAHVVHQRGASTRRLLQRFEASETPKIAPTFAGMLTQIKQLIDAAATNGQLNWDFLVEISGGTSAGRQIDRALGSKDPTIKSRLLLRYLFTCRCGLIDMRHFMQLLYISNFWTGVTQSEARGNRAATSKGREHELTAESASRFGAEDTPSNALGAATNLQLPGLPGPDTLFDAIKDTLTRCDPIDWSLLSQASKNQIVHFYGDQVPDPKPRSPGDLIPKNQNQTAVPDILRVAECGGRERSLPFSLDTSDPERKTLGGQNFLRGPTSLTSVSDIRAFVATQRPEIIRALPLSEKLRFLTILFKWPVRAADKEAIETIYRYSTADELRAESAIGP